MALADPQAILAMGLYLQFKEKNEHFSWATGLANIQNPPMDDYTPFHPSQGEIIGGGQTKKRDNLGLANNLVLDETIGTLFNQSSGVGWKRFIA